MCYLSTCWIDSRWQTVYRGIKHLVNTFSVVWRPFILLRCLRQVDTLIMMYKTHCQCILDNAINVNFEEVMTGGTEENSAVPVKPLNLFICSASDPEFPASFLAGNARPPAAAAGKPRHSRHLLCLWLHSLQGRYEIQSFCSKNKRKNVFLFCFLFSGTYFNWFFIFCWGNL